MVQDGVTGQSWLGDPGGHGAPPHVGGVHDLVCDNGEPEHAPQLPQKPSTGEQEFTISTVFCTAAG